MHVYMYVQFLDGSFFLTLGLLTGELAVSSKESSSKTAPVFLFLKLNFLKLAAGAIDGLVEPRSFHAAYEAASETKEEELPLWQPEGEALDSPLPEGMKSSKYMVQPLSSEEGVGSLEDRALIMEEWVESSIKEGQKEEDGRWKLFFVMFDRAQKAYLTERHHKSRGYSQWILMNIKRTWALGSWGS